MNYDVTELPVKLQNNIEIDQDTNCWDWKAFINNGGYGEAHWTTTQKTHRVVYELLVGEVPKNLVLDHLCRNRACCNPEHMEPVTNQENTQRGAKAVLDAEKVLRIRTLYAQSSLTLHQIADMFDISSATVRQVTSGMTWDNIDGPISKNMRKRKSAKGESHGRAKLTQRDVETMRKLRLEGWKLTELSEKFEVSSSQVSRVLSGKRWKANQPINVYP